MSTNPWAARSPLNFAHQGGAREAPSNTLYALKTAPDRGANALEIDLHMTSDGEVVVMHDDTVDRTTDGSGSIEAMTLEEIKSLDAAYWWAPGHVTLPGAPDHVYPFRGVATGRRSPPEGFDASDFKVPTLKEVLAAFPDLYLNMEIKRTAPDTAPYESEVARLLREFGRSEDVIAASFDDAALATFRRLAPEVSTSAGTNEALAFQQHLLGGGVLPEINYQSLQVPLEWGGVRVVDAALVEAVKRHGLALHVWTIDDEAEMRELLQMGVHGIMTDRPSILAALMVK